MDRMPEGARDAGELIASMRQLKQRSGLTYRQLEQRAAARGEVLARSTLADLLNGERLPRPEVLAAFVRACGEEAAVEVWLRARHRLARPGSGEVTAVRSGAVRSGAGWGVAAACAAVLVCGVAWVVAGRGRP